MEKNLTSQTKDGLFAEAAQVSKDNPGRYVIIQTVFNVAYATILKRIGWQSVGDARFDSYWLNGERKEFSAKQKNNYHNKMLTSGVKD